MKNIQMIALTALMACSGSAEQNGRMHTVERVDLERYAGLWYEIARLPNSFEKNMDRVTATYTLREDGRIAVLNQGYRDGKRKRAKGVARMPDPAAPGRLEVSFFLWFYADYLILDLDRENYRYALVGSGGSRYLWVLSRTPEMDPDMYDMLVARARELGFPVENLIRVNQAPPA